MSVLDIYYRAFKGYRKETADNTLCEKDRKAIIQSNPDSDKLETTKYLCHIEEDWVKAIEEGLVYVENAVHEERQFIRTNGEVVPIEKVKRISKDSVEHLAKHSEMITHVPEEDDGQIIPDKLYMVEKLSDFAVYENRFLYMMLCYLRDFINFRLEKIEILRNTYKGDLSLNKEIVTKKRTLVIETNIKEERTDNPFPVADEASASMVQRIKDCQQIVMSLLACDLMVQVAKTPMIKPPIVKTNVLKMNNNFKRALALYDFIATYKGLGYTYEEVKNELSPFSEKLADEIAEALNLTVFTAYKYGNDIDGILEGAYREEENRRKEEEAKKLAERIKRLKKRALESNKTLEEYMLLLEERNRALEKDSEELVSIRHEVEKLNAQIEQLNLEKAELERRATELETALEQKEREIAQLNQKYIDDMSALKKEHAEEISKLNSEHEEQVSSMKAEFAQKIEDTINEYESKIEELNDKYNLAVEEHEQKEQILNEKLSDLVKERKKAVNEYEEKIKALEKKYRDEFEMHEKVSEEKVKELKEQNALIQGRLDSMQVSQGILVANIEDTSREKFLQLQAEYTAFENYFKKQWKLTKKQIRKQVLWAKPEKPVKDKKSKKTEKASEQATPPEKIEEAEQVTEVSQEPEDREEN